MNQKLLLSELLIQKAKNPDDHSNQAKKRTTYLTLSKFRPILLPPSCPEVKKKKIQTLTSLDASQKAQTNNSTKRENCA